MGWLTRRLVLEVRFTHNLAYYTTRIDTLEDQILTMSDTALPMEGSQSQWKRVMKSAKLKMGKKKMKNVGLTSIMLIRTENGLHATGALCRHMWWPLAYGGKVEDGCVRCPLHQSTYHLEDGGVKEWSPFPLFPPYGRLLARMRKKRLLRIHEVREIDEWIEVRLTC